MRTTNPEFMAVSDEGDGCDGCAFAEDAGMCVTHACDPFEWPDDHYLHHARNVIWVRPN